ncbi:MAG: GAF domain-containing protein [Candidatus Doudnabacteria bacterium]|nr:GAF domain-containing protein [Candidatus Doudnabacteria bacterium]
MIFDFLKPSKKPAFTAPEIVNKEVDASTLKLQLEAVQAVSHQLINQTDLDETLDTVVKVLVKKLNYINPSIYILNDDKKTFSVKKVDVAKLFLSMAEKIIGKSIYDVKFSLEDENLLSKTITSGKLQLSRDLNELLAPHISKTGANILQTSLGLGLIIVTPVNIESQPIGCLVLTKHETEITEAELQLISTFSDQISIAIYNARSFDEKKKQLASIEEQNYDLASLFNLTSQISKSLDPQTVSQTAVDSLPQSDFLLGSAILKLDEQAKVAKVIASTSSQLKDQVLKIAGSVNAFETKLDSPETQNSPVVQAIKKREVVHQNDLRGMLTPLPERAADLVARIVDLKSVVAYPIVSRDKVTGAVVYFLKGKKYEELAENKKQLLTTYTLQITIALENANLYAESQTIQQNLQDALYQLKEARRQERDMIDVMGHELRTPISIVRNALVMVEKQFEKEKMMSPVELHKYLDMALESTRREITLIETLLSATKVDASRMQLYYTKVDLKDVVHDGIEGQRVEVGKKDLQIVHVSPDEEITVYADRTRIQEVMDNLYSNAVKYTPKGKIEIKVWKDAQFGWVEISDNGLGISAEDLQNLGKKFFRAKQYIENGNGNEDDNMVIRPGGTGLGLYVAFNLIRIMGCKLYINTAPEKGSVFTFCTPLYTGQPEKQIDQTFDSSEQDRKDHILLNQQVPSQPPS